MPHDPVRRKGVRLKSVSSTSFSEHLFLEPLATTEVPAFLEPYGMKATSAWVWFSEPPDIALHVTGHNTTDGHQHYNIACTLGFPKRLSASGMQESRLMWRAERRLAHMRTGLHDVVERQLGSSYGTYFSGIPFAHHMRPKGTTARLNAWCQQLALCINKRLVPPIIAATTLRFVGVPEVDDADCNMWTATQRMVNTPGSPEASSCSTPLGQSIGTTAPSDEFAENAESKSSDGDIDSDMVEAQVAQGSPTATPEALDNFADTECPVASLEAQQDSSDDDNDDDNDDDDASWQDDQLLHKMGLDDDDELASTAACQDEILTTTSTTSPRSEGHSALDAYGGGRRLSAILV